MKTILRMLSLPISIVDHIPSHGETTQLAYMIPERSAIELEQESITLKEWRISLALQMMESSSPLKSSGPAVGRVESSRVAVVEERGDGGAKRAHSSSAHEVGAGGLRAPGLLPHPIPGVLLLLPRLRFFVYFLGRGQGATAAPHQYKSCDSKADKNC